MAPKPVKRVTGLGGIFFKARDPKKMYEWYARHLGIWGKPEAGAMFPWRHADDPSQETFTVWSIFPEQTKYFDPSSAPFMINYQVEDLDAVLEALRAEGVTIDPKREDYEYGRFAWIMDPEGNRVELWEPPKPKKPKLVRK
ncbi:MAG TPA: VOC family protein [Alphaproteobacteria bacterium]|nr:VOC family protein [Alphaproteobacteria bacterium]